MKSVLRIILFCGLLLSVNNSYSQIQISGPDLTKTYGYNVKLYGATGNGTTDDAAAIQSCINACISETGNANIFFPKGRYKVSTQILIDNATADVNINGGYSTLVSFISSINTACIRVKNYKTLLIENLTVEELSSSTTTHHGFYIGDNAASSKGGVLRIFNCDFFGFVSESTRGITLENVGYDPAVSGNYNYPSAIIESCNFYNINTSAPTINYNTATYYGIGIYFGERVDYARVINCNFNYIRVGVWSYAGANMDITGCNFLACFPKNSGSYDYGAIYISDTGNNNGKINVTACKFNHNFGYSIWSQYSATDRPITVNACHFIANCATAIMLKNGSSRNMIMNNWFERTSQAFTQTLTNQPFGAALLPYIKLDNSSRNKIKNNAFYGDATYGVVSIGTSDYNEIKFNTWESITGVASATNANNGIYNNDVNSIITGSATLDFPSTSAQTDSDLTITVTGASDGDAVAVGPINASTLAGGAFTAWVSATNTVTVRFSNYSSGAKDPASGAFKVTVLKN